MTGKSFVSQFRVKPSERVRLKDFDPADTRNHEKKDSYEKLEELRDRMDDLQQRLFAERKRSLLICLQAIINVGVVTGVFPTKGMSLPFISAGLSNLLLMGFLLGIILNTQRTWGRATLPRRARSMQEVMA